MEASLTYTHVLYFDNFLIKTIDKKRFDIGFYNGNIPIKLSEIWNNTTKIKLLKVSIQVEQMFLNGTTSGEAGFRTVKDFSLEIKKFLLNGDIVRQNISNDIIIMKFSGNQKDFTINNGIIIDDIQLPIIIRRVTLDEAIPDFSNSPRFNVVLKLTYNYNY